MKFILQRLLGNIGPLILTILNFIQDRQLFNHVVDLAKTYVVKAEDDPSLTSGAEKRKVVIIQIEQDLLTLGTTLLPILLNLAIELAVSALTAEKKINKNV